MQSPDAPRSTDCLTRTAIEPDKPVLPTISRAIAAVENVPVSDLPPLYEVIDPDALDAIVNSSKFVGQVTFEYDGYTVTIGSGGTMSVYADTSTPATGW